MWGTVHLYSVSHGFQYGNTLWMGRNDNTNTLENQLQEPLDEASIHIRHVSTLHIQISFNVVGDPM